MKIAQKYRDEIVDELGIVRKKMRNVENPLKKMYYFSAGYGIIDRVQKLDYDPQLTFIHFVMNVSHQSINNRLNMIRSGEEIVPIPEDFFEKLEDVVSEIQMKIRDKKDGEVYTNLEELVCLSFSTTGPGYYMADKGIELCPTLKKRIKKK
jgi:hypothetical protein